MAKTSNPETAPEPRFEDALARLETIVTEMESGRVSLDESMRKFAEGMKLAELCSRKLSETEKKIEVLLKRGADGKPAWADFTPEAEPGATSEN